MVKRKYTVDHLQHSEEWTIAVGCRGEKNRAARAGNVAVFTVKWSPEVLKLMAPNSGFRASLLRRHARLSTACTLNRSSVLDEFIVTG